jgi:two-component sensor histidine kinase
MALRDLPVSLRPKLATLQMLVSELVTNSVKHAVLLSTDKIELVVRDRGDRLRVEIRDPGGGYREAVLGWSRIPETPAGRSLAQDGYGLFVVRLVADRSGVVWDNGTVTWFEFDSRTEKDASSPALPETESVAPADGL